MTLRVDWCLTCGPGNFGDRLTSALLTMAGVPHEWAPPAEAELFGVGSRISKVPVGFTGTVYGTGTIRPGIRRPLRRARVLAVRGELTRGACSLGRVPLGDPGILAPDLLAGYIPPVGATRPEGGTVVVPHYVDRRPRSGAVVPITTAPPAGFVWAIALADRVVTSSLHGLIAADALGIPHVLDPHPSVIGGLWKWADYASAFGADLIPGVERLTPRGAMAERQSELRELLGRIGAP